MPHVADHLFRDLRRLPGLYRRWELIDLFEPYRDYRIEDAGHHADGTPLLAIYVDDPTVEPSLQGTPACPFKGGSPTTSDLQDDCRRHP